jgi:hypothetical protein
MAASLLGYWPGEPAIIATPVSSSGERAVPSRQSINHEPSTVFAGPADWPLRSVSESNRSDEVYYDAPEAPVIVLPKRPCLPGPSDVVRFGLVPRDSNDTEDVEWRKFQPPKELFDVPYGTPLEIESIIIASVERLQQQFTEEQSFHENAAVVGAREESRAKQEVPVVEVTSQTEGGELLTVSDARRSPNLAHF